MSAFRLLDTLRVRRLICGRKVACNLANIVAEIVIIYKVRSNITKDILINQSGWLSDVLF